jgi:hypothetical protein
MSEDEEYELWQDDMMVAGASGPGSFGEIMNYARQYAQDGAVEVFRVRREKIAQSPPAPSPTQQGEGK